MNALFKILNNFKGFGEPDGNLWFIGVEEAAQWNRDLFEDQELIQRYKRGHFCESCADHSTVYVPMSKVIVGPDEDWEMYKDNKLLQKGSRVFQANLFPLGKPSVGIWPSDYNKLFEISREDYLEIVRRDRYPMMREYWKKYAPIATVCFGKTFWPEFRNMLKLNSTVVQVLSKVSFEIYPDAKVILTPFFGRGHMSDSRIQQLREILYQWGVDIKYA